MTKKHLLAGLIFLVAGSILIAACSAQQTPTAAPTIDANAIYTQAAQTVQAGLAQTQVVEPTAAPTETVAPTNTMDPNFAAAMTSTAKSVQPGGATATVAGTTGQATPIPTWTKAAGVLPTATKAVVAQQPKNTGDKAELVGQEPGDGSTVGKSDIVTTTLTFKNTGTTTWKKGTYALVYYAGDRMNSPADFQMPKDVAPGETVTMVFQLQAPDSTGTKKIIWVVRNADGVNFYSLWLQLEVK